MASASARGGSICCSPMSSGARDGSGGRVEAISVWPHDSPVDRNGGDHAWLERHSSTPLGRQQHLGLQIANAEEDQLAAVHAIEAHSAEPDLGGAAAVLGEDDLIGRQGDLGSVSEDHGRSRGTVCKIGSFDMTSGSRVMRVPNTNSMSNGYAFIISHPFAGAARERWRPEPR